MIGAGEEVSVARLTIADDPVASVRYGSRSRIGAAAATLMGVPREGRDATANPSLWRGARADTRSAIRETAARVGRLKTSGSSSREHHSWCQPAAGKAGRPGPRGLPAARPARTIAALSGLLSEEFLQGRDGRIGRVAGIGPATEPDAIAARIFAPGHAPEGRRDQPQRRLGRQL